MKKQTIGKTIGYVKEQILQQVGRKKEKTLKSHLVAILALTLAFTEAGTAFAKGGTCGCGGNSMQGKMFSQMAHRLAELDDSKKILEVQKLLENKIPSLGKEFSELVTKKLVFYPVPQSHPKAKEIIPTLSQKQTGLPVATDQDAYHNEVGEIFYFEENFSSKGADAKAHFLLQEAVEEFISKKNPGMSLEALHAAARDLTNFLLKAKGELGEKEIQEKFAEKKLGYYLTASQEQAKKVAEKKALVRISTGDEIAVLKNSVPIDFTKPQTLKPGDRIQFTINAKRLNNERSPISYSFIKAGGGLDRSHGWGSDIYKFQSSNTKEYIVIENDLYADNLIFTLCAKANEAPDIESCGFIYFDSDIDQIKTDGSISRLPVSLVDRNREKVKKMRIDKISVSVNGEPSSFEMIQEKSKKIRLHKVLKKGDQVRVEAKSYDLANQSKRFTFHALKPFQEASLHLQEKGIFDFIVDENDIKLGAENEIRINVGNDLSMNAIDEAILVFAAENSDGKVLRPAAIDKVDVYVNDNLLHRTTKYEDHQSLKEGDRVKVVVTARDLDNPPISYQFYNKAKLLQSWSDSNSFEFTYREADFLGFDDYWGITVQVRNSSEQRHPIAIIQEEESKKSPIGAYLAYVLKSQPLMIGVQDFEFIGFKNNRNIKKPNVMVQNVLTSQEKIRVIAKEEAKQLALHLRSFDAKSCRSVLSRLDDFVSNPDRYEMEVLAIAAGEFDAATKSCLSMVQESLPAILQERSRLVKVPNTDMGQVEGLQKANEAK